MKFSLTWLVIFAVLTCHAFAENTDSRFSQSNSTETNQSKNALAKSDTLTEKGRWFVDQIKLNARSNPDKAISLADQALAYFDSNPDIQAKAQVLNESSYALFFKGEYKSSMERALSAQDFAQNHQIHSSVARAKVLQGNTLQAVSALEQALSNYLEAVNLYRELKLDGEVRKVYNNIANTYFYANKYDAALEFYKRSALNSNSPVIKAKSLLGHAIVYRQINKSNLAIKNFEAAYQFYTEASDSLGQELTQTGLASELITRQQFKEAIALLDKALTSARKSNRRFHEVSILKAKSDALLNTNQPEKALLVINSAIKIASGLSVDRRLVEAYYQKSLILEKMGRAQEALVALRDSNQIEETISKESSQNQLSVMQVLFDLESKNHEIELLSSKNRLQLLQIKQQKAIAFAIVGILLFVSLAIVFYFYQRTQKRIINEHQIVSAQLKELDKLKDQVLANTSHELRTPLNGIIGMSQLLLEEENFSEDQTEKIRIISQCGERLLNLVKDITDFSQLQAGKLSLKLEPVDISQVTQNVCLLLENMARKKRLSLTNSVGTNLPKVQADPHRLNQVLFNLIGNAIKFSKSGVVTISAQQIDEYIEFAVHDQGIGIAPEKLDGIFNPFEQVDGGITRANEGSGLGLPITKELLKLHGSDIIVDSELGKGSQFSFCLKTYTS
ncbi:MAG: ATP-binding protein [Kangiellaceae bacterium]|nr:ATP-binding protein [Kangiellaceae bacterium]MCW9017733.1 ATP-binding protein [Kangiellaceae bacterium]